MKVYQITEETLASFEAWLELFLLDRVNRSVHSLRPAFDKVKIIKAFKEAFATEIPDNTEKPRGLKPTAAFFDELKGSGERELPLQVLKSQEDNIIKALNKIYSILYGILYPDEPNDKGTCLDDLQEILKTIEEETK